MPISIQHATVTSILGVKHILLDSGKRVRPIGWYVHRELKPGVVIVQVAGGSVYELPEAEGRALARQFSAKITDTTRGSLVLTGGLSAAFGSVFPTTARTAWPYGSGSAFGAAAPTKGPKAGLTQDEAFFWDHAGYSHDPKTETPWEGRTRGAKALAHAEKERRRRGWYVAWEPDEDPDLSWMDKDEREDAVVECAALHATADRRTMLASLCGVTNADDNHRRVVEAELALEAIGDVEKRRRAKRGH